MSKSAPDLAVGETANVSTIDPALTPEGFDLAGWLSGVTPVRRAVTIYGRGDLQASIDRLSARESALPNGAERDAVVAELRELTGALIASAATFIIEGRTTTWMGAFAQEHEGVDDTERALRQLAAQIVSPEVTYEALAELLSVREPEVMRLIQAMLEANSQQVALDPRFLPAASD